MLLLLLPLPSLPLLLLLVDVALVGVLPPLPPLPLPLLLLPLWLSPTPRPTARTVTNTAAIETIIHFLELVARPSALEGLLLAPPLRPLMPGLLLQPIGQRLAGGWVQPTGGGCGHAGGGPPALVLFEPDPPSAAVEPSHHALLPWTHSCSSCALSRRRDTLTCSWAAARWLVPS